MDIFSQADRSVKESLPEHLSPHFSPLGVTTRRSQTETIGSHPFLTPGMSDLAACSVCADLNGEIHRFLCREKQTVLNAAQTAFLRANLTLWACQEQLLYEAQFGQCQR